MSDDDYTHFYIEIRSDIQVEDRPEEPDGYCQTIEGAVIESRFDEASKEEVVTKVGDIEAIFVEMPLDEDANCDSFEVFDAHSQELLDLWSIFFTAKGSLRKAVEIEHGDFPFAGVLYIRSIKLDERVRGQGLGLKLLHSFIRRFDHCSLVALQASPLGAADMPPAQAKAVRQKLLRYWSRLGFELLGGENWMYLDPCIRLPNPFKAKKEAA